MAALIRLGFGMEHCVGLIVYVVCAQATAKADKVADVAQRVLEYRSALLLDGGPQRCGMVWKQVLYAQLGQAMPLYIISNVAAMRWSTADAPMLWLCRLWMRVQSGTGRQHSCCRCGGSCAPASRCGCRRVTSPAAPPCRRAGFTPAQCGLCRRCRMQLALAVTLSFRLVCPCAEPGSMHAE